MSTTRSFICLQYTCCLRLATSRKTRALPCSVAHASAVHASPAAPARANLLPDELKRVAAICAPCTLALPTPVQPTSTSNPHSSAPLHPLHPYTLKPFHPETLHLCTLAFLRPRALAPSRPGAFRPTLVTQIQILSTTVRRASFSSPVRTVRGLLLL